MATSATKAEQRTSRRFSLKLPVSIKCDDGKSRDVTAETRDLSAQGVFFHTDSTITQGAKVEFTLTLPPEITLTESIKVRCRGKVVRVDSEKSKTGVAAIIEQYDFVPDGSGS